MPLISMEYKTLQAGDVRQEGDEVRHVPCQLGTSTNYTGCREDYVWHPVNLLSHRILQSDLIAAEFRRPCKS